MTRVCTMRTRLCIQDSFLFGGYETVFSLFDHVVCTDVQTMTTKFVLVKTHFFQNCIRCKCPVVLPISLYGQGNRRLLSVVFGLTSVTSSTLIFVGTKHCVNIFVRKSIRWTEQTGQSFFETNHRFFFSFLGVDWSPLRGGIIDQGQCGWGGRWWWLRVWRIERGQQSTHSHHEQATTTGILLQLSQPHVTLVVTALLSGEKKFNDFNVST